MRPDHFQRWLADHWQLEAHEERAGEIVEGRLLNREGRAVAITSGIPRFADDEGYAASFGFQWGTFRSTQLDSRSGKTLFADRLWQNTKWDPADLNGKWVLEAGCGAGPFTEVLLSAGAKVVSVDLSRAVDVNMINNGASPDLFIAQANLYDLPFAPGQFDYVFCYGVVQHTPDPARTWRALYDQARPGGRISIDHYRRFRTPNPWSLPKYAWRPLTTRMDPEKLLRIIRTYIPYYLPFDTALRRVPYLGGWILGLIPVPCFNHYDWDLPDDEKVEWAVLDTFDALSAAYDTPRSPAEVTALVSTTANSGVDVFYGSNGVVANVVKAGEGP